MTREPFGLKTYVLACHACGRLHTKEAFFISTPIALAAKTRDGKTWTIPAVGCPECCADPAKPIKQAFDHGTSPEAMERLRREWQARQDAEAVPAC